MKRQNLSESVMAQITADNIAIKSKTSIIFGSIAMGVGLALLVALTVLITSLVVYQLRVLGTFGFLLFGMAGLSPFVHTIPWVWVGISGGLIISGYLLLKRYDFSYKTGYHGILLTFCLSVLGLAVIIDKVGIHEQMSHQPMLRQVYSVSFKGPNWMMGEVVVASPSGIVIMTPEHEQYVVHYTTTTRLPSGSDFHPGDYIRTVGISSDDDFNAFGISLR